MLTSTMSPVKVVPVVVYRVPSTMEFLSWILRLKGRQPD